jgi:pantoate--beta-alanine ligase
MVVVSTIAEVRRAVDSARSDGARIGFVPTMGALHRGHMSLVDRARIEADVTVMSIFVNPLQFGPAEDLSRYPRPLKDDERMASDGGVDVLFRPEAEEIYPPGRTITVTAGDVGAEWEGKSRPGHFDGVLTVVAKLFNIVRPDVAVFGRKDLQQATLVEALVRDLDMPLSIVVAPIVREADGLALSSRNRYLESDERRQATILNKALSLVRLAFDAGERNVTSLETAGRRILAAESDVRLDYLAIVSSRTFIRPEYAEPGDAVIIAARVGTTRLIDNMILGQDDQD